MTMGCGLGVIRIFFASSNGVESRSSVLRMSDAVTDDVALAVPFDPTPADGEAGVRVRAVETGTSDWEVEESEAGEGVMEEG